MGGPRALGDGRRGVKGPQADWNMHTHAAGAVGSCGKGEDRCSELSLRPGQGARAPEAHPGGTSKTGLWSIGENSRGGIWAGSHGMPGGGRVAGELLTSWIQHPNARHVQQEAEAFIGKGM